MSVASEIERIQSAKADLKTSINAKTDSSHQITDETIDEYANFVDSIQTGGGGGQVYRLPDAYQEVEYIESSGTQYINTGYYATGNSKFELKVTYRTTAGVVYGSYNSQGVWTTGNGYYHNSNTSNYEYTQYLSNSMTSQPGSVNTTHTIVVNKGNVTVNGTVTNTIGSKTFTQNYPTFIFAGNNAGTIVEQPFAFKLYYFRISEGTSVLRDFVPCYRKSDNEVGLYDLINDVFYTNQGTGTFAKGNNHNTPFIKLQTKNITITTNTTTTITPDAGYDGLASVIVTTNVTDPTPTYSYEQNGLIAWYEGEDNFDSNEHLNSRVGSDYLYVYSRATGNSSTNPASTSNGSIVSQGDFLYSSSQDYYVNGYTIEIVGYLNGNNSSGSSGGWLFTGNTSQTAGVGSQDTSNIIFQNDGNVASLGTYTQNKPFNASLYLKSNIGRNITSTYVTRGSVNGSGYTEQTGIINAHSLKSGGAITLFLGYYINNYWAYGGIKSIRVYNRQLTNEEMYQNYLIDKARFNLD